MPVPVEYRFSVLVDFKPSAHLELSCNRNRTATVVFRQERRISPGWVQNRYNIATKYGETQF